MKKNLQMYSSSPKNTFSKDSFTLWTQQWKYCTFLALKYFLTSFCLSNLKYRFKTGLFSNHLPYSLFLCEFHILMLVILRQLVFSIFSGFSLVSFETVKISLQSKKQNFISKFYSNRSSKSYKTLQNCCLLCYARYPVIDRLVVTQ